MLVILKGITLFSLLSAITVRILSNPYANVVQKKLVQNGVSSLIVNFMMYFLMSLACLIFFPLIFINKIELNALLYAFVGGFFGALGNACLIKAIEKGELSVLGPINSYKAVVGLFIGIFALKEIPNIIGVVGILLIIVGSYFVFDTLEEKFTYKLLLRKDILFRIAALILTATEAIFIKKVIILTNPTVSFAFWCWFGAFYSLLLILFNNSKKFNQIKKSQLLQYVILAVCMGLMQLSTNFVFAKMNVGYALALFQLSTLVSVFFGYKYFHEKNIKKKIIGSLIMIIGAVSIILN